MHSQLTHLRALLHQRFPAAMPDTLATPEQAAAFAPEVALLQGKLLEVVAAPGCAGAGLLLNRLLQGTDAASGTASTIALVDGGDGFDPAAVPASVRERLLWVRCLKAAETLRATDLLLRDGNLDTVLVDLRLLPRRDLLGLPSSIWHRLRMLAERSHAGVGIFSPCQIVTCAARRWILDSAFTLDSLEQEQPLLLARLRPRLQRGAGAGSWKTAPETIPAPLAIAG